MATIQFLAGNPKKGSAKKKTVKKVAKKASKKAPTAAQLKARANFVKMVRAKAKASKASKKVAPKKAIKKAAPKKAHKKAMKKKNNPQRFMFGNSTKVGPKEKSGMWFPTVAEINRDTKSLKNASKVIKNGGGTVADAEKIKILQAKIASQKSDVKKALAEKKALLDSKYLQIDHQTKKEADQEAYEEGAKKSKLGVTKASKAKYAKKAAKKGIRRKTIKKAKKAKQTKQGVFTVAKKKAKKKSSKKVSKKVVAKKAAPKRRKSSKKVSKKKSSPKRKAKKRTKTWSLTGKIKTKGNPSIAGLTGQSDNMAVAGLAIGGFSYNLFNDLGKRYLPSKVMEYIAMAGPVSGAVIPSAVAGLVLFAASKYPQNKMLKHASGIAKGVIASAVVIAGASVYQVVAQPMVKKTIGLAGDEMYGYEDDMSGQADIEFSGQSDSEFSGQSDSSFSGDEDEFGEDEF
jgi:hypothetical protein